MLRPILTAILIDSSASIAARQSVSNYTNLLWCCAKLCLWHNLSLRTTAEERRADKKIMKRASALTYACVDAPVKISLVDCT